MFEIGTCVFVFFWYVCFCVSAVEDFDFWTYVLRARYNKSACWKETGRNHLGNASLAKNDYRKRYLGIS